VSESSAIGGVGEGREDPVQEAAARWVARLSSSDATAEDRRAFEAWLAADPAHGPAYAAMDALWGKLGRVEDPWPSPEAPPRSRRRPTKGLAGIAVSAVFAGALAYQLGLVDRMRADVWSGVGDIRQTVLPDGSRVDLNTDTALALRFSEGERTVELLRGEAFFDVAPDPDRPFVVWGSGLSARALGTRFAVRADDPRQPVEVAEGRVAVTDAKGAVQLSAGEAARREGAGLTAVPADVGRETAWRQGRLIVSRERLASVLAKLGRYRRGRIVLLDAAAGERRVTGVFDLHDTDDALTAIGVTMGVRVTRVTPLLALVGSPL
jgi:transmembrane sensor